MLRIQRKRPKTNNLQMRGKPHAKLSIPKTVKARKLSLHEERKDTPKVKTGYQKGPKTKKIDCRGNYEGWEISSIEQMCDTALNDSCSDPLCYEPSFVKDIEIEVSNFFNQVSSNRPSAPLCYQISAYDQETVSCYEINNCEKPTGETYTLPEIEKPDSFRELQRTRTSPTCDITDTTDYSVNENYVHDLCKNYTEFQPARVSTPKRETYYTPKIEKPGSLRESQRTHLSATWDIPDATETYSMPEIEKPGSSRESQRTHLSATWDIPDATEETYSMPEIEKPGSLRESQRTHLSATWDIPDVTDETDSKSELKNPGSIRELQRTHLSAIWDIPEVTDDPKSEKGGTYTILEIENANSFRESQSTHLLATCDIPYSIDNPTRENVYQEEEELEVNRTTNIVEDFHNTGRIRDESRHNKSKSHDHSVKSKGKSRSETTSSRSNEKAHVKNGAKSYTSSATGDSDINYEKGYSIEIMKRTLSQTLTRKSSKDSGYNTLLKKRARLIKKHHKKLAKVPVCCLTTLKGHFPLQ